MRILVFNPNNLTLLWLSSFAGGERAALTQKADSYVTLWCLYIHVRCAQELTSMWPPLPPAHTHWGRFQAQGKSRETQLTAETPLTENSHPSHFLGPLQSTHQHTTSVTFSFLSPPYCFHFLLSHVLLFFDFPLSCFFSSLLQTDCRHRKCKDWLTSSLISHVSQCVDFQENMWVKHNCACVNIRVCFWERC